MGSKFNFLKSGLIKASFQSSGNLPLVRQVLIIIVISSMISGAIFLKALVGIGSSLQCFDGIMYILSRICSVDMCLYDDIFRTSLTGGWYFGCSCRSDLILFIFSIKKAVKDLARSLWLLSQSGSGFSGSDQYFLHSFFQCLRHCLRSLTWSVI